MGEVQLALAIYALAAAISMAVAAVIKILGTLPSARATRPAAPEQAAEHAPLDEAEVAAIAAAIHATIGRHRIVHLAERSHGEAWAAEGRAAHHGSHDVARHGHTTRTQPKH